MQLSLSPPLTLRSIPSLPYSLLFLRLLLLTSAPIPSTLVHLTMSFESPVSSSDHGSDSAACWDPRLPSPGCVILCSVSCCHHMSPSSCLWLLSAVRFRVVCLCDQRSLFFPLPLMCPATPRQGTKCTRNATKCHVYHDFSSHLFCADALKGGIGGRKRRRG